MKPIRYNLKHRLPLHRSAHIQHRRTPPAPAPEVLNLLQTYEGLPPNPIPLAKLLSFGESLSPASVVASAEFVLTEIPKRLAHRVRALDRLPFIVGTNPFIAKIHHLYQSSFRVRPCEPHPWSGPLTNK